MKTVKNIDTTQNTEDVEKNIANIKHKFIVISGKGGVGKTTVSVSLAYSLALKGYEVGLLDVDIHGPNVNKMVGLANEAITGDGIRMNPIKVLPNLKVVSTASIIDDPDTPIIWRGPLKMKLIRQFLADVNWGYLDYLIIDSPPGTGDEPLSVVQLINDLDGAIVVTTPQEVALLDARKSIQFAKKLGIPFIGIVENMSGLVCPHCSKNIDLFGTGGGKRAAIDMGVTFLGEIPMDPEVIKLCDKGKAFAAFEKNSVVAAGIIKVAEVIEKYVESQNAVL